MLIVLLAPLVAALAQGDGPGTDVSDQDESAVGAPAPALLRWVPAYDPPDPGVVALGERLFFSLELSGDRSLSCASCHQPEHGFADPRPLSIGVGGATTRRHTPALLNRALGRRFSWDGAASTLEEQVLLPISNPVEMGSSVEESVRRLTGDAEWVSDFNGALGRGPDREGLAACLSAFVRSLWTPQTPFDRFRAGNVSALNDAQKAGFWLFESRGGCWRCHSGPNFTDEDFHNTGVGARDGRPRPGRYSLSGKADHQGAFKTPTLRGLTRTGPYMHDGSLSTLRDVVEFYSNGGTPNSNLSPSIRPLELSEKDVDHLVAFLRVLSEKDPESVEDH